MAMNMAENKTLSYTLRALQLIFAIIVMGTDGYAIHVFRGHTVYVHFEFGNFYSYYGVPNAWGFLMFCAAWTVLIVIFHLIAGISFADRALIGYIRVAVEAVAVLSWLAGFIAVAVQISTDTCSAGKNSCGSLKAATVFGAFEWLLFVVTAALTVMHVFNSSRSLWISEPADAPQTSGSLAIVF
ncbi:hypothetical protein V493_06050 [Pseudogymnoascus sp. VKM F-4281 (FW-2241)]|nr:hypothetical protein V493_06050 [Pseudogymnoascus sp. VKM F-4281 (FW-2241)]